MTDAPRVLRLAARALIRRADEVLLTWISPRGHHFGSWTLPGGGVGHGEEPRRALALELVEETGLRVEIGSLLDVHRRTSTASI
jgi:8-oxo-dGTP diphosphatase